MRHGILGGMLLCATATAVAAVPSQRIVTFEDRVAAQKAIERVYWGHRIWPSENPGSKPPLSVVMSDDTIRGKVEDYLEKSNTLERRWQRPITGGQLQAELDRMARDSTDRNVLRELFEALHNDPALIAETLARQTLAERLVRNWFAGDARLHTATGTDAFDGWWKGERTAVSSSLATVTWSFTLPSLDPGVCTADTWRPTKTEVPDGRANHVAVWTGSEMIVWGGAGNGHVFNTGGCYDPATDTWTATSVGANVPVPRNTATAVWTGTEMIVWGGLYATSATQRLNTGARYDPASDTWTPTSTGANVPPARFSHTAVWTGTEMIVWGGHTGSFPSAGDGGRYNPVSDTWLPTSTAPNAPTPRTDHTAIWTGDEMIMWGGTVIGPGTGTNAGGRYNPASDSWVSTSTGLNVPAARKGHTAVWTGSEMIVWGGQTSAGAGLKSGGRYSPGTNSWLPTSVGANVPAGGMDYAAVWTGSKMIAWRNTGASYDPLNDDWTALSAIPVGTGTSSSVVWTGDEMIVWGGAGAGARVNTGARYNPITDSWVPTSMGATVPPGAERHASVWTGSEMIVWGGFRLGTYINTGGAYSPATDSWVPTSVGTNVPAGRELHTAIWTGTEIIVWGGFPFTTSGGRYDPAANAWEPTSVGNNIPSPREYHTAVWTGSEMIVWGGSRSGAYYNSGGRYIPVTDSWMPTSLANVPEVRIEHVAVWTGSEMIVWGGDNSTSPGLNTGGRYNPVADSWSATSTGAAVPSARWNLTAVWTGTEMIVWGGYTGATFNTGGRYNPLVDSWNATSTGANVPSPRGFHAAAWTGTEMLVFGGQDPASPNDPVGGGRYDPATDGWVSMPDWPYFTRSFVFGTTVWTGSEMIVWGGVPYSATGVAYCACPAGRLVYRDADGDGYGDPGRSAPSCDGSAAAGFVVDSTDCDDVDPDIHPDAAEVCNGLDDNCDGVMGTESVASEVGSVSAVKVGVRAEFTWAATAGATHYDMLRGRVQDWPVGSNAATETCVAGGVAVTTIGDDTVPAFNDGYWYLVRADNACGSGSYGSQASQGLPTFPRVSVTCP